MSSLMIKWSIVARTVSFLLTSGLVLAFFGLAEVVCATTIDDFRLEGSYGSGDKRAALVVDFSSGTGDIDSFAFEVRFGTSTITGFQLLDDVQGGTNGAFQYTTSYGGAFVQSMSYQGRRMASNNDTGMSLMYWTSINAGTSWNLGWDALGDTVLSNNDSLGWLSQTIYWDSDDGIIWYSDPPESEWRQPVAPTTTPEPSTLVLAASGGLTLLWWRWRRRRK
jgi:hypothetical protein